MPYEQSPTVLIIGIAALVALVPWAVAVRRARAAGDWDLTSTFVFLVGMLANLPTAVYVIHTGRPQRLDPLGDVVIGFPQWVDRIGTVTGGLILVGSAVFLFHRLLFARATLGVAPLLAAVVVVSLALSDGLQGQQALAPRQLTLLAVLLATCVARPGRPAFLGAASVGLCYAALGGLEALVAPETVLRECTADNACGVMNVLYSGVFTNENIFSLLVVVCIPFAWLAFRGRVRVLLACYLAFVAVATGSRLAEIAAVVTLTLLAVLRPRLPDEGQVRGASPGPAASPGPSARLGRLAAAGAVLGAAIVAGLVLPFHHARLGDFGIRATIWEMAATELPNSPLFGFGARAWSAKYRAGEIPAAVSPSLHNQWMDVLYAGGIVGLVLFAVLLACLLFRGGTKGFPVAACVLAPVLLASVVERPWSFGITNSMTFALMAAVLVPVAARATAGGHSTTPGSRAAPPAAAASGSSPGAEPARTPRR